MRGEYLGAVHQAGSVPGQDAQPPFRMSFPGVHERLAARCRHRQRGPECQAQHAASLSGATPLATAGEAHRYSADPAKLRHFAT